MKNETNQETTFNPVIGLKDEREDENIHICSFPGCSEHAVAIGREAQTLCQKHYDEHLKEVLVKDEHKGNYELKMKVRREDNLGATLIDYQDKEFFIAMEDISSIIADLAGILNSERLDWRESAGG